jgi:hypothetical protein
MYKIQFVNTKPGSITMVFLNGAATNCVGYPYSL